MHTINLRRRTNHSQLTTVLFYSLALTMVCLYFTFQPALMSFEQVQQITTSYDSKVVAYAISFLLMLLCALTPLPAEIIALGNTFIYSPAEAFLVTWLSGILSAQAGYELGRLHGFDPCENYVNNKICRWLNAYGYKALAIMRLIPLVPFFALNIGAGVFRLNRFKYTVITALTIIPAVALLTLFPHLFL
jgi:uncharacterized membrane protein YdjX (TVP38/TMEM64 family)